MRFSAGVGASTVHLELRRALSISLFPDRTPGSWAPSPRGPGRIDGEYIHDDASHLVSFLVMVVRRLDRGEPETRNRFIRAFLYLRDVRSCVQKRKNCTNVGVCEHYFRVSPALRIPQRFRLARGHDFDRSSCITTAGLLPAAGRKLKMRWNTEARNQCGGPIASHSGGRS